ncbi:MAG: leucine-rich repeat domain-containing protein [Bacteroides sp.]|nr:leucine-rich repeat domain-containing protein [Bacteroides sp.]
MSAHAQATSEVVQIDTPGTLEKVVNDLESSRFMSLTIRGNINAVDIAYLNSGNGKVAMVDTLNLRDAKLIPGDEAYSTLRGSTGSGLYGYRYYIYHIGDEYKLEISSESNSLGGYSEYYNIWCNDLSGAFSNYGKTTDYGTVILPSCLTKVGEKMFIGTSVKEVVIPDNVTSIGEEAFKECRSMTSMNLPVNIFEIGNSAFASSGLEAVNFPTNLSTIGEEAFYSTKLESVNLENVRNIGKGAFGFTKVKGEVNLANLDSIPSNLFENTQVSVLKLSPNLSYIGNTAFTGTQISSLDFPSTLKYIGNDAFHGIRITSLTLPEGLETIGESAFIYCSDLKEVTVPSTIRQIGAKAFAYTPWGNSLKGENGIVYIANVAYDYDAATAAASETLTFRDGTVAISDGISFPTEVQQTVKKIKLPSTLVEIGNYAFSNFEMLGEVALPQSLRRIGDGTFSGCTRFWCTLPEGLQSLGTLAFERCKTQSRLVLPESLRYIGNEALSESAVGTLTINSENLEWLPSEYRLSHSLVGYNNNNNLKKIIIGPKVSRLPDSMFANVSGPEVSFEDVESSRLTTVGTYCFHFVYPVFKNFPSGLRYIGGRAFTGSTFESGINLSEVKYLGEEAFCGCKGITSVVIHEDVDTIGGAVFSYCPDLRYVEFNAKNYVGLPYGVGTAGSWGSVTEYEAGHLFDGCDSLKEIVIGSGVKMIPAFAFYECRVVEKLSFAERGEISRSSQIVPLTIGNYAFAGLGKLTETNLPDGTESLGEWAFAATGFKEISIPATVKTLGEMVFNNCMDLKSIYFNSVELPTFEGAIDSYTWADINMYGLGPTIYVPEESYELYKDDPLLSKYKMEAVPTSAIEDIIADGDAATDIIAVYDITGRSAMTKWANGEAGIYIVKMSDGTVRKVMR